MAPLLVLGLPPSELGAYSREEGVEGTGEAAVEAGGVVVSDVSAMSGGEQIPEEVEQVRSMAVTSLTGMESPGELDAKLAAIDMEVCAWLAERYPARRVATGRAFASGACLPGHLRAVLPGPDPPHR